jgi:hypothetical protein
MGVVSRLTIRNCKCAIRASCSSARMYPSSCRSTDEATIGSVGAVKSILGRFGSAGRDGSAGKQGICRVIGIYGGS